MENTIDKWPDHLLRQIFQFLPWESLANSACVCKSWNNIDCDDFWHDHFVNEFGVSPAAPLPDKASSWKSEFERLHYKTPSQRINAPLLDGSDQPLLHKKDVLDVSFSHDGSLFVTCSNDASFIIWQADWPFRRLHRKSMRQWDRTIFSQFNKKGTLLLVSGTLKPAMEGEIAIFQVQGHDTNICLQRLETVKSCPRASFSVWLYSDQFLSGPLSQPNDNIMEIWLTKVQSTNPHLETDGSNTLTSTRLHRVNSINYCNFTRCLVASHDGRKKIIYLYGEDVDFPNRIGIAYVTREQGCVMVTDSYSIAKVNGHIVAFCLSPDSKKLYYMYRTRLNNISFALEYNIEVLDLTTNDLQACPVVKLGKAQSPYDCYLLGLDVSEDYIISGSEDGKCQLLDRHYGIKIGTFYSDKMINKAALSPRHQEILVTVSDDCTCKIWQSRHLKKKTSNRKTE